jgi:molybdopterin biosynthesis enzyme
VKAKAIPIEESVGLTLAYDLTGITPGTAKGAVLRRGHVIGAQDLDLLRDIGKSHIKVLELGPREIHEDEAAEQLARMFSGSGVEVVMPGEAWADIVASTTGLLKVDRVRLLRANLLDDVLIAARHDSTPVKNGELVARAKVRGLAVEQTVLDEARRIASSASAPVIQVLQYRSVRAGAVITGREVYEGRRKDAFEPLLRRRLEEYGSELVHAEIVPDEVPEVARALKAALAQDLDLILVTGGGSPDDSTAEAIAACADEVAFHGAPVAPGAMSMLAYAGGTPILGVPAGLLARPRGFIDLVLPRLLAGERLRRADAAAYGHGGLCLRCDACVFPDCPFGK